MTVPGEPTESSNPYAPPSSLERVEASASTVTLPAAAIVANVVLSCAWTVRLALRLRDSFTLGVWVGIAVIVAVWGMALLALWARVRWARPVVRALALLGLLAVLNGLRQGGSDLFFVVGGLRALIMATLIWSLRPPRARAVVP